MQKIIIFMVLLMLWGFIGLSHAKKKVDFDCNDTRGWYDCRDIEDAPQLVQDGYDMVENTPVTLGPWGNIKGDNGEPIVYSTLSCTSCHFGGGQVPEGIPFFQVKDKYAAPGKYWRPKNRMRQIAERTNWCLVNCANGQMLDEDSYAMKAIVAYLNWVAEGLTDPNMIGPDNWQNIPGHTWPPLAENFMEMQSDPFRGEAIYENRCDKCHGIQGPGQGRYDASEPKADVPALWGERSFTKGAFGMHAVPNLARLIVRWMPLGDADLGVQEALDVAGFINSQERAMGPFTETFFDGPDPATGMPNYYFKPAYWAIGTPVPDDPFPYEQRLLGPWAPIQLWQEEQRRLWIESISQ